MKDKVIVELKKMMSDCTYTAEAHHLIAEHCSRLDFWSRLVPAALTAVLSVIEVYLQPESNLLISLILASAVATAVSNALGAKEKYESHITAAKKFTRIKKLANKALNIDAYSTDEVEFKLQYETLLADYLTIVDEVPPTESWAFKKAQKHIQGDKVHEPD